MWCDAKCGVVQCQTRCAMWWCDVECWCGTRGIWWCAVMQDVKCGCGIPSDVEWFDAILDMVVWCGMLVEMQCGMCGVVWNVCCGIVRCVIYIWMRWCAWRGVRCNVGVMWNGVLRCGGVIWCELWSDVKCGVICMWNVMRCGMLQFQTSCDVECDWNAKCGMWCLCM